MNIASLHGHVAVICCVCCTVGKEQLNDNLNAQIVCMSKLEPRTEPICADQSQTQLSDQATLLHTPRFILAWKQFHPPGDNN